MGMAESNHALKSGGTTVNVEAEVFPVWEVTSGVGDLPQAPGFWQSLKRDAVVRRSLVLVDIVAAYLALLTAAVVLGGGTTALRPTVVLLAPFVVLLAKTIGLYDRDQYVLRKTTIEEAPSILYLSLLYALIVWIGEALLLNGWLDRPQVIGLAVVNFTLVAAGRAVVRATALSVTPVERCVVVGSAVDAERVASKLEGSPSVKAAVVGRVALHSDDFHARDGNGVLGDLQSLGRVLSEYRVERIVIAPDSHDQEEVLQAVRLVKALGVKVSVLPRLLEVVGSSSIFDEVDGLTLLGVRPYGLSKSSEFLKRVTDLFGAIVGLAFLGPLLVFLAIVIKLDSRGPVFFRQPRIGRRGERFEMIKFRSMVRGAEQIKAHLREHNEAQGGLFKITNDPRATRVGRFLRQTSTDELPQLLNVLKGNMSLVGPRPLVPDEDALIEGWQRRRLAVKPGMTGLWQIYGSSRIPMSEMVKIDYLYGANWSIWLDLKVLIRTVPYVLRRRGR